MTIVEFLTARLDEDEQVARAAVGSDEIDPPSNNGFNVYEPEGVAWLKHFTPARALADVAAKRALVEVLADLSDHITVGMGVDHQAEYWANEMLKSLAAVYSDHPDYQQEWKP